MSYDISIYDRGFLRHAIETGLGDWSGAVALPAPAVSALIALAAESGFVPVGHDPGFVTYLNSRGLPPSRDFEINTEAALARLSIHSGEAAFTIPYSDRAEASVRLCERIARQVASSHGLGYYDPQLGVAEY